MSAKIWERYKAVVFESDDWGQCYVFASAMDLKNSGPYIPASLRGSGIATLESAHDLVRLHKLLASILGRDGRPAIFQPNYILANPDFESARCGELEMIMVPEFPSKWIRPGWLEMTIAGVAEGVWYPELHGFGHYDLTKWIQDIRKGKQEAIKSIDLQSVPLWAAGKRGFFDTERPYYDAISEYGSGTSSLVQKRNVTDSVSRFESLFGRNPGSVIAPAYCWQARTEKLWAAAGIRIVQAKNRQNCPPTMNQRIQSRWNRLRGRPGHPTVPAMGSQDKTKQLSFLNRNVDFEPILSGTTAKQALTVIEQVWKKNEPAIISSHRINFTGLDETELSRSLEQFEQLLLGLARLGAVFLTDNEVAQIYVNGWSWLDLKKVIRFRNTRPDPVRVQIPNKDNDRVFEELVAMPGSGREAAKVRAESGFIHLSIPPGDFDLRVRGS